MAETAFGKSAGFVVSHPADGAYQAITAPRTSIQIARPVTPAESPQCKKAKRHKVAVGRQYRRLIRNAARARGNNRRRLQRRANRMARKLRVARSTAQNACNP